MQQLLRDIRSSVSFPSPPTIALQIIDMAADPDLDAAQLARLIGKDPALAAKVLRVANSPLYSKRRKSENLRQALVVLGLNGTISLVLSFSLLGTYRQIEGAGIDYVAYWRCALLKAAAARVFANLENSANVDTIFLAALLQELAVIALDRVRPDFYGALTPGATHADIIAYEQARLGTDHAALGAALFKHWGLPEAVCTAIEFSHAPQCVDAAAGIGARCLALGGESIELLTAFQSPEQIQGLAARAQALLGIAPEVLGGALKELLAAIPEIERLFEMPLLSAAACAGVMEQARELLTIRNLQAYQQVVSLREAAEHLQVRTAALEDQSRIDALTGIFNRRHLDGVLDREFEAAKAGGWPLSVLFADLDHFKQVNDTYGHAAGDRVLSSMARLLQSVTRDTDCIARYGGEEFVIVLPGLATDGAVVLCERLMKRLRDVSHAIGTDSLKVTASLGLATHHSQAPFAGVADLLAAADRCVYAAKRAGRDRLVVHEDSRLAPTG
jgi:diguanylate cyclase (GGDEF)-like protein